MEIVHFQFMYCFYLIVVTNKINLACIRDPGFDGWESVKQTKFIHVYCVLYIQYSLVFMYIHNYYQGQRVLVLENTLAEVKTLTL